MSAAQVAPAELGTTGKETPAEQTKIRINHTIVYGYDKYNTNTPKIVLGLLFLRKYLPESSDWQQG